MLELLLLRRALLASSGSCGCNPLTFANRFKISVRLITPLSLPDILAPVIAEALIEGAGAPVKLGGVEDVMAGACTVVGRGVIGEGGTSTAGVADGVGGPDEAGEGVSTTHMRWERVATSLATV